MRKRIILLVIMGVFTTELVWQVYKTYRGKKQREKDTDKVKKRIADVMFFSEDSALCRPHALDGKPCTRLNCAVNNLSKLVKYINSTKSTLDVCMYIMTCKDLANAIANVSKRGVIVRVITDASMAENEGSRIIFFREKGIKVRLKPMNGWMHHKFVVIDRSILITGSTNWTMTAFFGNFDNVLVTNERSFVQPFVEEFHRLWAEFDSNNDPRK